MSEGQYVQTDLACRWTDFVLSTGSISFGFRERFKIYNINILTLTINLKLLHSKYYFILIVIRINYASLFFTTYTYVLRCDFHW